MKELIQLYNERKDKIKSKLNDFKQITNEKDIIKEFLFCTLTPQSNAKKCWQAVEEITKKYNLTQEEIANILKTKARFHNNKSKYIISNLKKWEEISEKLDTSNRVELRNWLNENVDGYGLKEAGHFLRNIGKSENQIAILDRHILRNLKALNVIDDENIKNKAHYLEIEQKFLNFSKEINIPIDELDLLFWSKETGEIFK